jgi:hypothetical protein
MKKIKKSIDKFLSRTKIVLYETRIFQDMLKWM